MRRVHLQLHCLPRPSQGSSFPQEPGRRAAATLSPPFYLFLPSTCTIYFYFNSSNQGKRKKEKKKNPVHLPNDGPIRNPRFSAILIFILRSPTIAEFVIQSAQRSGAGVCAYSLYSSAATAAAAAAAESQDDDPSSSAPWDAARLPAFSTSSSGRVSPPRP